MLDLARPIAVGGASSSGTTLLAVVLDRHAHLACGPELSVLDKPALFDADWTRLRPRLARRPQRNMEIPDLRWRRRLFDGLDGFQVTARELGSLASRADSAKGWLEAFAALHLERSGKRRWAEKTPSNIFGAARFLETWPEGRFVHVVRDGRDCVVSQVGRGRSLYWSTWIWMCAVAAGWALRDHPRCLTLRYEDLARDPEATLRGALEFLGEDFDASLLHAGPAEARAGHGSWSSTPDQPINANSVGRYRQRLDRASEGVLFSFSLSDASRARYGAPFSSFSEALRSYGYDPARDDYPDKPLDYILRLPPASPWKRLRRRLRGRLVADHVPEGAVVSPHLTGQEGR